MFTAFLIKGGTEMSDVVVKSLKNLQNEITYGPGNKLLTDEPLSLGGEGKSPDPYTLILAALGSCISMTTKLYAKRKGWPLEEVTVRLRQQRIHVKDCEECGTSSNDAFVHKIERSVSFKGKLSVEQIERLHEISHKCPVHKTLSSRIVITDMKD